jgi:parvulin-like peptidyl-prolyl isomerase
MAQRTGRTAGLPDGRAKGIVLGLVVLLGACETESGRVLARADGHELTVDQMVEILARQNTVPNQADVVDELANLWIDYTLLGLSAREDSLFTTLDLDPLLRPQLDQEMINEYMNSAVEPDTAISDEDLRALWEADPPADSVRAQHILLAIPGQATQAQLDSVTGLAVLLQERATAGESFEALAGQYSDDNGSAIQGGDIGFFSRGMLMPSFEEAAFSLAVGEVSAPVLSSLGLHVIKVTDRRAATFEGARSAFRDSVVLGRLRAADSTLLAQIDQEGEIEIDVGAVDIMRELARNPRASLSRRAASRTLVSYRGGSYSVSDALLLLNTQQTNLPGQLAVAPDEALNDLLNRLGQSRILLERAAEAGITPDRARLDSLDSITRERVRAVTEELGLRGIAPLEGETADEALDRTTLQLLREISAGTRSVIQMSAIMVALRREADWEVLGASTGATVERIDDLRGAVADAATQPGPVLPSAPPGVPPGAVPPADSVQN